MTPDDDVKALHDAGFDVVYSAPGMSSDKWMLNPGDMIVRRKRPPAPVESDCVRMYGLALGAWPEIDEGDHARMKAAFNAALAREIAAAEQRGYHLGYDDALLAAKGRV